eukprot:Gregarina_sp_Poly_1__9106@NODE_558_length_7531_cov_98_785102_g439_i0_p1_GENE_NODE_558_length_7531_cov_98_785102_g439_i0NODE_558_length_7531_cov_98_785102_g439_i0_p1_ORF_typecomplete_len655_score107_29NIF/PF03031_18/8_7e21HAD_2/PF13419_6/0_0038DUF705/PF05152_12/41DUF705/PF05152_12/1_4_NODE_558_length_7531_cov_98_785102_g439_i021094073
MSLTFRIPKGLDEFEWTLVWSKSLHEDKRFSRGQKLGALERQNEDGASIKLPLVANKDVWIQEVLIPSKTPISRLDEDRPALHLSTLNLCKHDVVLGGLCAGCGEMIKTAVEHKRRKLDHLPDRIKLGFVASDTNIQISKEYAESLTASKISGLLHNRKLMLVLDLDNTLAHAFELPPPLDLLKENLLSSVEAEQLRLEDVTNPIDLVSVIDGTDLKESLQVGGQYVHYIEEHEQSELCKEKLRVLESHVFRMQTCVQSPTTSYYASAFFKLRPGVIKFLRDLSAQYELYLYTAGTLEHAESSLRLLDPGRTFFGTRVFARTSIEKDGTKSLSQILPTDHEMIVVIDDTSRVWAADVALFMCYPYFWHRDEINHFLGASKLYPESFLKWRAAKSSFCQFSPSVVHTVLTHRLPSAKAVKLDPEQPLYERLQSLWSIFDLRGRIGRECPNYIWDTDLQLYCLIDVLKNIHDIYFKIVDSQIAENWVKLPSCKKILSLMRVQVLQNCIVLIEDSDLKGTDLVKLTHELGATIIYNDDLETPTHVVTDVADTRDWKGCHRVDISWLECAICTLSKPKEDLFSPELCVKRRHLWDATRSARRPRNGVSTIDKMQIDNVEWHADLSRCLEIAQSSLNVKPHSAVFEAPENLEEDLLAGL